MRITNASMVRSHLYDTQQNLAKMNTLSKQIASGKVITKVSDDPQKAVKIMKLNNEVKYTERYNYNIDETVGWMNNTDASMESFGNLLGEIKESIIKVGNGTYSEEELSSVNAEMNEKLKEIVDVLNSTHGGKHMFGGTNTDEPPMKLIENADGTIKIEFNQSANDGSLKADISDGMSIEYNLTAKEIFNGKDKDGKAINFLDELNKVSQLMNKVVNGSEDEKKDAKEKLMGDVKDNIDNLFNHSLNKRTSLGTKVKTAENIKELNEENIINMKELISLDQDADQVEKFIELKSAELVYQASIQVGSKLIQPTILDYMR